MAYEARPLRRQKIRYNSANTTNPLVYQLVVAGAKVTPTSATITVYSPGVATPLVSAAAMTASGSLLTYAVATTTTASWPVGTGYRARIATTVGTAVYYDDIMFDVAPFVLLLDVGRDQLAAIDERIVGMAHAGDEDFSEIIEAVRDELQARIETRVIADKRLLETMVIDKSRVSVPARYLILARIWESKRDFEQADRYQKIFDELWAMYLGALVYDENEDLTEDSRLGSVRSIGLVY